MSTMIEPTAGRLFDMYYRYNVKADLTALQSLTREAYNLHERLCKLSEHKNGLLDLDEFLLLTALGNYFVPQDDFLGKTYVVTDQFAKRNKLGLLRVCLVDKKTARLAIDAELARENGGQEKAAKIQAQLVKFGDAFNIEPVIYNFMVKVYKKLANMRLSITSKAYSDIDKSYRKELYNHDPHYLPLKSITASNDEIQGNSTLLARLNIHEFDEELPPQFKDTFNEVSALDIDLSKLGAKEYSGDDYKLMHDLLFEKIISHANIFLITRYLPKHLGVAIISENKNNEPEIAPFDIQMQKAAFEAAAIQLDPAFYQTTCYELLVIFIFKRKICPVILSKTALFEFQSVVAKLQRVSAMKRESALTIDSLGEEPFELNINHEPIIRNGDKLNRNAPCPCGSGKKYKKCCLQ